MMTLYARVISICLIAFVASGCYTQIRSPLDHTTVSSSAQASDTVVQRFEYYHYYGRDRIYDPYDFRNIDFYESNMQWIYTRRTPHWYRHDLIWDQACWVSVYHPQWRRYPPAVLVPYVVYHSPILNDQPPQTVERQRPQVRQTGFEGTPASGEMIRVNHANTRPQTEASPSANTDSSSKQATTEKKKEEEKEEKRTEKRDERKKRGGMR
ncbi:MAG: hypothetical protein ACO36I_11485 [Candidatus Latescibacterota bacterium]